MAELFPIIQPQEVETTKELPLYKTVAWDFEKRCPIFQNGNPVYVYGKEGVKVWCWIAIMTQRTLYEIYSWDFGSELEALIGQAYTKELKEAEAVRYVKEALLINPYITDVNNTSVLFENGNLIINATVNTVYGEFDTNTSISASYGEAI